MSFYCAVYMLNARKAENFVKEWGVTLAFPDGGAKDPPSLWHCFHPRKKMRWEWDVDGDHAVADLWIFREKLSRSGRLAYAKWYKDRQNKASFLIFLVRNFLRSGSASGSTS